MGKLDRSYRADSLDRAACKLVFTYGSDAAMVAYTKAVFCEAQAELAEARRWRGVLGRVAAIDSALVSKRPLGPVMKN